MSAALVGAEERPALHGDDLQDALPERRDLLDLAGRVIVVTGAGSGLGRATALLCAVQGARVVTADRDAVAAERTAAEIVAGGFDTVAVGGDVSDAADVDAMVDAAIRLGNRLDGMCAIAGMRQEAPASILEMDEGRFDRIMAVNARGVMLCLRAAARVMVEQRSGSIVAFSSATIDRVTPGVGAYAASKAAVAQLTRTAARELGPHGVRVNAIAPGWIETTMSASDYIRGDGSIDRAARAAFHDAIGVQIPLGPVGRRADIAAAAVFLLSDAARFVTGQTLRVNGGMTMA